VSCGLGVGRHSGTLSPEETGNIRRGCRTATVQQLFANNVLECPLSSLSLGAPLRSLGFLTITTVVATSHPVTKHMILPSHPPHVFPGSCRGTVPGRCSNRAWCESSNYSRLVWDGCRHGKRRRKSYIIHSVSCEPATTFSRLRGRRGVRPGLGLINANLPTPSLSEWQEVRIVQTPKIP
jgi:hypothetical protein